MVVYGQTDGDITLWGVNGEQVPLSRPTTRRVEGLMLRDVPDGLSGYTREHIFDDATGEHRGITRQRHQVKLNLLAQGKYPRQHVDELLDAMGTGDEPVTISVMSPEMGERWKEFYLRDVSELNWHTHPMNSPLVIFSVILEAGRPEWQRTPQSLTLTAASQFGWVNMPVRGDMDVWPAFTITGGHEGVSIRLREDDQTQTIPHSPTGWVVDSRPEHRVVADLDGTQVFNGFVPFWPEPARNIKGTARVEVLVDNPAPDFQIMIEYTPEATRAW